MTGIAQGNISTAGGVILPIQTKLIVKGQPAATLGSPIASHGPGPHVGATMVQGSAKLTVDGVPVVLAGHRASCNHVATGNPAVSCSA
jgi:uncharacterized Zn-binding protein involved in type VI secretion